MLVTSSAFGQTVDNPYKRAKVGDWTRIEVSNDAGVYKDKSQVTSIVTGVDAKQVTIKESMTLSSGKTIESQKTIDLVTPFPLKQLMGYGSNFNYKIRLDKSGKGAEVVAGKRLEVEWNQYTLDPGGAESAEQKLSVSSGVPLDGVVESTMVSKSLRITTRQRLIDFGFSASEPLVEGAPAEETLNAPRPKETNSIGITLVLLPKGDTIMGTLPYTEFMEHASQYKGNKELILDAISVDPPQRPGLIANDYWLGAHEVTIGQFGKFVADTEYVTDAEKDGRGGTGRLKSGEFRQSPEFTWRNYGFPVTDEHPVANITWQDAVAFCKWLSDLEGRTYRLPTEAEWEHGCRAKSRSKFYCGETIADLNGYANVADAALKLEVPDLLWAAPFNDSFAYSAPIGEFKANNWSLNDMHGNLTEWCSDKFVFGDTLPEAEIPDDGVRRHVVRGGNWFSDPTSAGSASRIGGEPTYRNVLIGFRVVREGD